MSVFGQLLKDSMGSIQRTLDESYADMRSDRYVTELFEKLRIQTMLYGLALWLTLGVAFQTPPQTPEALR